MCKCQKMPQQRCGIDDKDTDEHVVVLWLQEYECGGCQAHPHKSSIKQPDANLVVVVFAHIVYDSNDDQQYDVK